MNLDTRCFKISGVISCKHLSKSNEKLINDFTASIMFALEGNKNIDEFYYILHTDTDTLHYHYCLITKKSVRLSTMLNYLATSLNVNPLAISIQKCSSVSSVLRYFTHIDTGKEVYSCDDIISNMNLDTIKNYFFSDDDSITFERLVSICKDRNEIQVMSILGLRNFHKYRYEIKLLCDNSYYCNEYYNSMTNEDK